MWDVYRPSEDRGFLCFANLMSESVYISVQSFARKL